MNNAQMRGKDFADQSTVTLITVDAVRRTGPDATVSIYPEAVKCANGAFGEYLAALKRLGDLELSNVFGPVRHVGNAGI